MQLLPVIAPTDTGAMYIVEPSAPSAGQLPTVGGLTGRKIIQCANACGHAHAGVRFGRRLADYANGPLSSVLPGGPLKQDAISRFTAHARRKPNEGGARAALRLPSGTADSALPAAHEAATSGDLREPASFSARRGGAALSAVPVSAAEAGVPLAGCQGGSRCTAGAPIARAGGAPLPRSRLAQARHSPSCAIRLGASAHLRAVAYLRVPPSGARGRDIANRRSYQLCRLLSLGPHAL